MVSVLAKPHFGHVSTDSCTKSLIVMAPIRIGIASFIYCFTLLALEDGRSCRETRELAGRKLAIVESRLTDLNRLRKTLRELIARCDTSRGKVSCPIISVLSSERS